MGLTFEELRVASSRRCEEVYGHINDWTPTDWGCALAGETGELCNKLKKNLRGDKIPPQEIAEELADVVIYADLLATRLGLHLEDCVRYKFNKRSIEKGCDITL